MKSIHYRIIPSKPVAHIFEVSCIVQKPDPTGQVFSMPAWIPGSYMIRDFAKNIITIKASCGSGEIKLDKTDKQTWRCEPCEGPLTILYEVYAWDLSVRSVHLDTTHAYFNGTSVFMSFQGYENEPCSVEILRPEGSDYANWQVSTAMTLSGAVLHDFGAYQAANYEELIDHPVEMGGFTLDTFEVAGVPHDIVITGRHRADRDRLKCDLAIICEHHVNLFGELPEMDRYVFQIMAVGEGYGGLEHRASTSLLCSRYDLPLKGVEEVSEQYRAFLGLCSHEYFHTWNIKRIKPKVFSPYDLTTEVYTHLMWMFEGITSYYDDLALVRAGLITPQSYLELLGQNITRVIRGSGRLKQTVWDSSFYTWTKFYKQDENAPNAIVSYYGKGALIAMGLDLTLRQQTAGKTSLDDVMRYLWQTYGKTGEGVDEKTIEDEIEKLTRVGLGDFFTHFLRGTGELPLSDWLTSSGVDYQLRPPQSSRDKGGKKAEEAKQKAVILGARFTGTNGGVRITHVLDGGVAQQAGLSAGDIIIAIDNIRIDAESLDKRVGEFRPGEHFVIQAFRRDELIECQAEAMEAMADTCVLSLQAGTPDWLMQQG